MVSTHSQEIIDYILYTMTNPYSDRHYSFAMVVSENKLDKNYIIIQGKDVHLHASAITIGSLILQNINTNIDL